MSIKKKHFILSAFPYNPLPIFASLQVFFFFMSLTVGEYTQYLLLFAPQLA